MKSARSYKVGEQNVPSKAEKIRLLTVACALGLFAIVNLYQSDTAPVPNNTMNENPTTTKTDVVTPAKTAPLPPESSKPNLAESTTLTFAHQNIKTTIFWVGEGADTSNGYIANVASAWDEKWSTHYGGVDSPSSRNGYYPSNFTPKENPFYVALPYNDFDEQDNRRPDAGKCANANVPGLEHFSWCKGTWIAVRRNDKIVYAQWQDVGPFYENDSSYIFGSSTPINTRGVGAGLDVSPAVRDFLGLQDVDVCDWTFVNENQVPDGPWKQITSSNPGTRYNN